MFFGKELPHRVLSGISFAVYSTEEILNLSVKEITNPQLFDDLSHPTQGGLYDPALGPTERDDICGTCSQVTLHCPGHMGHIILPLPVYNPLLFKNLVKILKSSCFYCHRIRVPPVAVHQLMSNFKLIALGLIDHSHAITEVAADILAVGETYTEDTIKEKFKNCVDEIIKEHKDEVPTSPIVIKNVVEMQQALIKEFYQDHMDLTGKRACPFCKVPARELRADNHCKIFFSGKVKQTLKKDFMMALQQRKKKKLAQMKHSDDPEVTEEEVDEDMEQKDPADAEMTEMSSGQVYLTPIRVQKHLHKVWRHDGDLLQHLFGTLKVMTHQKQCPTDIFFLDCVPVPASRFRPLANLGDQKFESRQTANLSRVLNSSIFLRQLMAERSKEDFYEGQTDITAEKQSMTERVHNTWLKLQTQVNCVLDSDLDKMSKDAMPGIKQLLEKKEGIFRKHMMGKRVDYAARSVISPDPYINTDEVGIPDVFAKKLTYPEVVTPWNVQELSEAVRNGPEKHPGASFVVNEDGYKVMLNADNHVQREAIARQLLKPKSSGSGKPVLGHKKVYRHLKNGDVLLMNRQPTLHRPSIQAHKARVLTGEKTLRLHYANCKAYNADFDGDEMNAHFPQNELARAEAYHIVSTNYQYLVPKDGTPLAGLIQDHMISGVLLTIRGRFFTKSDYQQLVYSTLTHSPHPIKILPPTIMKPGKLWSGKQVISTILLNLIPKKKPLINLIGKAKIPAKSWNTAQSHPWKAGGTPLDQNEMSESEVVIRHGELLVGVLDKAHYGSTQYSLVHCCYEIYGPEMGGKLLTALARVFTIFLQQHGFTLGVEDILCTPEADEERHQIMKEAAGCGPKAAAKSFKLESLKQAGITSKYKMAHFNKDDTGLKEFDHAVKGFTDEYQNQISKACMPMGLHKKFPKNNLQLMVQSGAKGSTVNTMQISCLLGQIELEGRRPPLMMSGRALPSFRPYDVTPRAGGFVDGRFLTGIRPQEYFFHCMAGREGLIDTAVKTSRSGYLQRCIIKHLEGLQIAYDLTVRDSDGSVLQFNYGDDSLDVPASHFLNEKQFPFLINNFSVPQLVKEGKKIKKRMDMTSASKFRHERRKIKRKAAKNPELYEPSKLPSAFQLFSREDHGHQEVENSADGRTVLSAGLIKKWRKLPETEKKKYHVQFEPLPPILSKFPPDRYFGAISDRLDDIVEGYIAANPDKLIRDKKHPHAPIQGEHLKDMISLRCLKSLAEPGQPVGLLAAQSIGEPSTQMTLNTFHFAGRGEMNVTLGIPRLREILMVASENIKTPAMEIPLQKHVVAQEAQKLQKKLNKVCLSDVIEDLEVCEYLNIKSKIERARLYRIRVNFLPHESYEDKFCVTPAQVLECFEMKALRTIATALEKKLKDVATKSTVATAKFSLRSQAAQAEATEKAASNTHADEEEEQSSEEENDGDAVAAKNQQRHQDERDYEGEEEERMEMSEHEESDIEGLEADDSGVSEGEGHSDQEGTIEHRRTPASAKTKKSKKRQSLKKMDNGRLNRVLNMHSFIDAYKYDPDQELWCEVTFRARIDKGSIDMISLFETISKKIVIHETPLITRGILSTSKKPGDDGKMIMKTEGVNIMEMFQYDNLFDLNHLYCNEIHAICRTYGIEAACKVIIKEIRDVFAAYGINVDYHHLSLIADYMTFEGRYKPFNRIGIESNSSPLQKMSFETTMHFLRDATISGARDNLQSPSARLVTGQPVYSGTGSFEVMVPLMKTLSVK